MLMAKDVKPEWRDKIPAVVHVDGTARVQMVRPEHSERLYQLLREFDALTGVPVLVNTSLNLAGEPIVESPVDVVSLFERSRLDALVLERHLIAKAPLAQMLSRRNPGPDAMARAA